MAAELTSTPAYNSPTSFTRGRQRRGSTRQSFTSPNLPPGVESPRTLCPKDREVIRFDSTHLAQWYLPQELWVHLPSQFQATLIRMQHAGAGVVAGFARAGIELSPAASPSTYPLEPEAITELDDSVSSLPAPMLRSTSDASSRFSSSFGSPALVSTPSSSQSPPLSALQDSINSPVSPICLTPLDPGNPTSGNCEHPSSTPLQPHDAYYVAELSQLRTESLPRLRHAAFQVDKELLELKRQNSVLPSTINDFEAWWKERKPTIGYLDDNCKRRSVAAGISTRGLGWACPPRSP